MGAPFGNDEQHVKEAGVWRLFLKGTGAGAADITLTRGLGINPTVDQTGTGLYTITLTDKWKALLHADFNVIDTTTPDEWVVNLAEELVSTSKTIKIAVFKGGTLADLSTDEVLTGEIVLTNSSLVPVKGA